LIQIPISALSTKMFQTWDYYIYIIGVLLYFGGGMQPALGQTDRLP